MINKSKKQRIRNKIKQKSDRARIIVSKSNKHISAQIIDPVTGNTIVSSNDHELKGSSRGSKKRSKGVVIAEKVGKKLADKAKKKDISQVVFDRSGYSYEGKVKALAEGARKGGLDF